MMHSGVSADHRAPSEQMKEFVRQKVAVGDSENKPYFFYSLIFMTSVPVAGARDHGSSASLFDLPRFALNS
jgi:hypothetical protein